MNRLTRVVIILITVSAGLSMFGCFSFSGPNDIRNAIARSENVVLQKNQGISVGPVGIGLVQMFAGSHLPVKVKGLSSVDYGSYTISSESAAELRLSGIELNGYERIVRVRDGGEEMALLVGANDPKLKEIVCLIREGNELQIVRVKGDLEQLMDGLLDSDLGEFRVNGPMVAMDQ